VGAGPAAMRRTNDPAVVDDLSPASNVRAKCSICQYTFSTAQEFYEHLDDCVLNEIVPMGPKLQQPRQRQRLRQQHHHQPQIPQQRDVSSKASDDTSVMAVETGLQPKEEPVN
jgi:hypothetical protein